MVDALPAPIYRVRLTAPDKLVRAFLARYPMQTESVRSEGEMITIEVMVPQRLMAAAEKLGLKADALVDASALGRERLKEVGRGNRFQGEQRFPRGLGTLTRK